MVVEAEVVVVTVVDSEVPEEIDMEVVEKAEDFQMLVDPVDLVVEEELEAVEVAEVPETKPVGPEVVACLKKELEVAADLVAPCINIKEVAVEEVAVAT